MPPMKRIQVQFRLPYSREARDDELVRGYLDRGWRIAQLQRLSDQEAVITFEAEDPTPTPERRL